MAVLSLNALVGSIGVKGGILHFDDFFPFSLPPCQQDEIARKGLSSNPITKTDGKIFPLAELVSEEVPDSILNSSYPVNAVLLYRANPVFSSPDLGRWVEAIKTVPFVVSMTSFLDETSMFADIILPLSVTLESWQATSTRTLKGVPVLSLSKPVVEPLYDTLSGVDILLRLTKSIGGTVSESFPWQDASEALKESLRGLFTSGQGEPLSEPPAAEEESWIEEETKPTLDKWFKNIAATGGWTDKKVAEKLPPLKFKTPSGKFEFYSLTLRKRLGEETPDIFCLPHVEDPEFLGELGKEVRLSVAPQGGDGKTFHLYLFVPLVFKGGEGAHLPYLQGIAGSYLSEHRWETWVEINPETADELGLENDEFVWVVSPIGRVKARVKRYVGVPKDVVAMPLGLGHTAYGRWAQYVGSNPSAVVPKVLDKITGQPLWQLTLVRIVKEGKSDGNQRQI